MDWTHNRMHGIKSARRITENRRKENEAEDD